MKRDWLENILKDKLSDDIQSDINLDSVWEDIEEIRYPKKRRQYLFFLLPIVIGLGVIGIWFLSNNTQKEIQAKNIISQNLTNSNEKNQSLNKTSNLESEYTQQTILDYKDNETTNFNPINSVSTSIREAGTEVTINEKANKNSITFLNNTAQTEKDNTVSTKSSQKNKNKSSEGRSDINNMFSNIKNGNTNRSLESASLLSLINYTSFHNPRQIGLVVPIAPFNKSIQNRPTFELSIRYSYGLSSSTLSGSQDMIEDRLNNEQDLDAHQLGLYARKYISPRLSFRSGLEYAQHIKLYKTDYTEVRTEQREDVILEIIQRNDGTTEYVRGEGLATVTESGQVRNYQRYRTVGIPIFLGYSIPLTQRFLLQLDAGISLGYSLQNSGYSYYNSDTQSYVNIQDLGYKNKFNLAHKYSIGLQTILSESMNLNFGVNSSWDFTDRNVDSDVSDKFNRYGFYFGLSNVF